MKCTLCASEISPGSVGEISLLLKRHLDSRYEAERVGYKFNFNGYTAEIVKVKDSWDDGLESETSSYAHQGETFEAYIIYKVNDFFFKKAGTGDSYGEVSWDGGFGPVEAKPRVITVYEF